MREAETKVGQLLDGKYRVQQLLAVGGMGFVYAARHEVTGRSVALKLLRPELVGRPDLVERVSREARIAVEASHPNVVQVLDAGADENGVPYLVLERLYGQPLDAFLNAPLSLGRTVEALMPVINALAALHRAGIVHRDLKPSNIFISCDEGGRIAPKLLDFGIAKALEAAGSTLTGVALGTPAYMAPEQLLCAGAASPASDVWSLGVVCVRCLTGRLPFAELASRGLASLQKGLSVADVQGIPEPVAQVLGAALRIEPADRPASAVEFRVQLLAALRALAPAQAWPDEASVSFARAESELAAALEHLSSASRPAGASERGLARPRHGITRTLSQVWQSVSSWRSPGTGSFVLSLGVLAALAVAILGRRAGPLPEPSPSNPPHIPQRTPPIEREGARPLPENGAAPEPSLSGTGSWSTGSSDTGSSGSGSSEPARTEPASPDDDTASGPASRPPRPHLPRVDRDPRTADARRAAPSRAAPSSAAAPAPQHPEPAPEATDPPPTPPALVVGANRSPIIE